MTGLKTPINKKTLNANVDLAPAIDDLELDREAERELWIILLLRGIAMVLFGFTATIWPGITIVALGWVFAVYILIAGFLDIINGFRSISAKSHGFLKIFLGLCELGVGFYLLRANFVLTTAIFVSTVGLILILQAIIGAVVAISSSESGGMKFLMLFSAFLTIAIGFALLRYPLANGLVFLWILGFYGIFGGAITIVSAFLARPSKQAVAA